jgi:hypothetical protein
MFFAVLTWAGGFLRNARQAMLVGRRSKDTVFALFRQGLFWMPLCEKSVLKVFVTTVSFH